MGETGCDIWGKGGCVGELKKNEKGELISDIWGKRGATYGEKGPLEPPVSTRASPGSPGGKAGGVSTLTPDKVPRDQWHSVEGHSVAPSQTAGDVGRRSPVRKGITSNGAAGAPPAGAPPAGAPPFPDDPLRLPSGLIGRGGLKIPEGMVTPPGTPPSRCRPGSW